MGFPQRYSDFTEERYRDLVRLARERFAFVGYRDIPETGPLVLWRHDLDCSVHRALRLARIEAEEGATATYFIHPHSEFYSSNERVIVDRLVEIRSLGHRLGLHFDPSYYRGMISSASDLEARLTWERTQLEHEVGSLDAFSFHNPDVGGNWLSFNAPEMAGMANAYGAHITSSFAYCSDSNGYWRFKTLEEVLRAPDTHRLHVLTHPEWWCAQPMAPRQRIVRALYGRLIGTLAGYDALLEQHGRANDAISTSILGRLAWICPEDQAALDLLWNSGRYGLVAQAVYGLLDSHLTVDGTLASDVTRLRREVNAGGALTHRRLASNLASLAEAVSTAAPTQNFIS